MILKRIKNLWAWSAVSPPDWKEIQEKPYKPEEGETQFLEANFKEKFERAEKVDDLIV